MYFVKCFCIVLSLTIVDFCYSQVLNVIQVASGLSLPTMCTYAPGDSNRLFILEQYTGRIKILRLDLGTMNAAAFLDLNGVVNPTNLERGLLSLCFHPDYQNNGYFYVGYNDTVGFGNLVVSRFQVSANPDSAVESSEQIMFYNVKPAVYHNACQMVFGPNDGYMYIGFGDGQQGDPQNFAQRSDTLAGKILRLDVDSAFPYAIPPDNPYVGPDGVRDEIFARGLRNPWRFTLDPATGDMYIGDVGPAFYEEINFIPDSSQGRQNFGWRCMEGDTCTGFAGCTCHSPSLTAPLYTYRHTFSAPVRCAVIGGFVYRGCAMPELRGTYFFGDYCSNEVFSFRVVDGAVTEFMNRSADIPPSGVGSFGTITSFGEDARGEIYICGRTTGRIWKIVPENMVDCNSNNSPDGCDIAIGTSLDVNTDGIPDECECFAEQVLDLTTLPDESNIKLFWTAFNGGNNQETYSIYRSYTSDAPFPGIDWTQIASGLAHPLDTDSMAYTDFGIVSDSTLHFYVVTSVCP